MLSAEYYSTGMKIILQDDKRVEVRSSALLDIMGGLCCVYVLTLGCIHFF